MKYNNNELNSSFISGACTKEKFKKQGFMTRLLEKTFLNMFNREIEVAYLFPFNHAFYTKYGFVTYTKMKDCFYDCEVINANLKDMNKVCELYKKYCMGFNLYTLRAVKDFEEIFLGVKADGGKFYLLINNGEVVGYNYYDSFSEINELVTCDSTIIKNAGRACHVQDDNGKEYSMIRIVNAEKVLNKSSFNGDFIIKVKDDVISENNFSYNTKTSKRTNADCDFELSIDKLADFIFNCTKIKGFSCAKTTKNLNFEKY